MIETISQNGGQNLTTAFYLKQKDCNESNYFDHQGDSPKSAARIPVIKSTLFVPEVTSLGKTNNDKDKRYNKMPAPTNQATKKPYGGRPLKYECNECNRRFHAPSHLKRHVMSHSSERPFQCDVCAKGFLQAWHLGRHMTTHTGNKPFKCLECSKSFGSRFEMKTHINYIHRGIKEHQCRVCGKHFTLRSNLKVHMRKHTGEKPYKCTFCPKRFGQRGHLQYHIRKHDGQEEGPLTKIGEKVSPPKEGQGSVRKEKCPSVSDHHSDCHDDDVSMTSDKDSGIGGYDSEIDSITTSLCSSPRLHDSPNDQLFKCNDSRNTIKRQPSPEFDLVSMTQCLIHKEAMSPNVNSIGIKPYVCYSCNCGFAEVNSLRAHIRHSHPRKGIESGDYRCAYCLKSFASVENLQKHVHDHQKPNVPMTPCLSFPRSLSLTGNKRSVCCPKFSPKIETPRLSAKSLAFSIDNLCADVVPKKKKMAQITHLHTTDPLQHMKEPTSPAVPSLTKSEYTSKMEWMKMLSPSHPNLHSCYYYEVDMHPMSIY